MKSQGNGIVSSVAKWLDGLLSLCAGGREGQDRVAQASTCG